MKLLIVTGAGASRELGAGRPLPLMYGVATAFIDRLQEVDRRLPKAIGLSQGLSGAEFEATLGEYFQWRANRTLTAKFWGLRTHTFEPTEMTQERREQAALEDQRIRGIDGALNEVLFDEFRADRIDERNAVAAYQTLFHRLNVEAPHIAFATTNYDLSLEMVATELFGGYDIGAPIRVGRDRAMDASTIELWGPRPAILHLHGAVGWYRTEDDRIEVHGTDRGPQADRGAPAMLYPDPNKDPTSEVTREIWEKLEEAARQASHIMVLGHSLHDQHLVDALQRAQTLGCHLGLTYYAGDSDGALEPHFQKVVSTHLAPSDLIPLSFGPEPTIDDRMFKTWASR